MHASFLLAFTFFASIDTVAATPAQKDMDALLFRFETTNPESATIAMHDGNRIIIFQSQDMAVEVRASKHTKTAANIVANLASRFAGKRSVEKHA